MLKLMKRNKLFTICLIITTVSFIAGIMFNAIIDDNTKSNISTNINNMLTYMNNNTPNVKAILSSVVNNFSFILLLWLLGMSVIGIPIILFLYLLNVFMFSFEFTALISNLNINRFFFIIAYQSPKLINIIVQFILIYYSINYSIVLIKLLFFKNNYNMKKITKRYLKVLLFCILCSLLSVLLKCIVLPKILTFLL